MELSELRSRVSCKYVVGDGGVVVGEWVSGEPANII